ncbi:MAG TPA: DUF2946 domain-containing protein [Dyella sp.]|uniref:DUF2946 domain-containing protein n=1 Tax=Dyella sp. TaxID=1869338 RepID=UPI002D7765F6|nr:DUF2946 domain-containing protein [Dyella sp.]HET6552801.1 DUF2946 domain-containing protein [Dyella sp.]
MIHRRAKSHRVVAWLALLAMGLMLFAPLVSRALESASAMPAMSMADCMDMPGMAPNQADHASGKHHQEAARDPASPSTDACGYCSLLFHSPALAVTVPVLPVALPLTAAALQVRIFRIPALRLPARRSRGPPLA